MINPARRRWYRSVFAATAIALSISVGACGSDDTPDNASNAASDIAVDIAEFNFKPQAITVDAGTDVSFTNQDGFAHTVTADDGSFDSPNLEHGAKFEHTFEEAGIYKYHCKIHISMTGTVTVS